MDNDTKGKIKNHIARNYGIEPEQAERLLEELPQLFPLTASEYICQRHLALQQLGFKNSEIYRKIGTELEGMVFSAGSMSERQIRRIIYG